ELFESRPVVASAGDLESGLRLRELSKGTNENVHAFVAFKSAQVDEERVRRSERVVGRQRLGVDSVVDDANPLARYSPLDQIISGALAYRFERRLPVQTADWALTKPEGCGKRGGSFAKCCRAEKMVNQRYQ